MISLPSLPFWPARMIFLNCNRDCLLPPVFQVLKWLLSTSWTMSKFHDVVPQRPLVTWLPIPTSCLRLPLVCSVPLHPFTAIHWAWNAFLPLFYLEGSSSPARFIRCHSSFHSTAPPLLPPPGEITRGSCCLSSRMLFSCMFPTRL